MPEARILLVEDESNLAIALTDRLQMHGYRVETAKNGTAGFAAASSGLFDLIILDVMLPGMNGFELCRKLRDAQFRTPVLMLTARDQLVDKVEGLRIGADDYMTKPFEAIELLARVEALLRRAGSFAGANSTIFRFGEVEVDLRRAEVAVRGRIVGLSIREFQLLRYFLEHRGETLRREELLEKVWGFKHIPATRTVDVHVTWLRQKLEENPKQPRFFVTVRGLGYRFDCESAGNSPQRHSPA